jgi:hypothetical protein
VRILRVQFDSNNFIYQINELCSTKKVEYIDAVIMWCEKNNVELEFIAGIIKKEPTIKMQIQAEAENLNFLKGGAKLPV